MSRCTTPRSCEYAIARATSRMMPTTALMGSGPSSVSRARSDFPFDERHRVVRQPVRVARRDDRDDVRLLERRDELDLTLEPFDVDARGQLGREQLDDDLPVESLFVGDKNARHAATAKLALKGVRGTEALLQLLSKVQTSIPSNGDQGG